MRPFAAGASLPLKVTARMHVRRTATHVEILAPAKINLFLHVGPPGPDGYHPLCSLMVFADVGDRLRACPAQELGLQVTGPFAGGAPAGPDNLVLRAARALLASRAEEGAVALELDKALPVAAEHGAFQGR